MKKIAIIPTLLTLGNAVCGFAAIAYASKIALGGTPAENNHYFGLSGWLIIAAMVFDTLDGYVARLAKSVSSFGRELDSLCDAISFGVAPAFLLLRLGPGPAPSPQLHQALAVIAALYMACALLRLARFNLETTTEPGASKRFRGLPSPAAAGCVASLAILRGELAATWPQLDAESIRLVIEIWAPLGTLMVALLMVSRIPFPHLTKQILRRRRPSRHLADNGAADLRPAGRAASGREHGPGKPVPGSIGRDLAMDPVMEGSHSLVVQILLVVFVILLVRDLAVVLIFWGYALGISGRYLLARSLRRGIAARPLTSGSEDLLLH